MMVKNIAMMLLIMSVSLATGLLKAYDEGATSIDTVKAVTTEIVNIFSLPDALAESIKKKITSDNEQVPVDVYNMLAEQAQKLASGAEYPTMQSIPSEHFWQVWQVMITFFDFISDDSLLLKNEVSSSQQAVKLLIECLAKDFLKRKQKEFIDAFAANNIVFTGDSGLQIKHLVIKALNGVLAQNSFSIDRERVGMLLQSISVMVARITEILYPHYYAMQQQKKSSLVWLEVVKVLGAWYETTSAAKFTRGEMNVLATYLTRFYIGAMERVGTFYNMDEQPQSMEELAAHLKMFLLCSTQVEQQFLEQNFPGIKK